MTRRHKIVGLVILLALASVATAAFITIRFAIPAINPSIRHLSATQVQIDLLHPDARVISQRLSSLPRDILLQPQLKLLLTEEFAFYYDEQSQKMALDGSFRRLAYEHQLTVQDHLLQSLLDAPATVSLWRSHDGRLGYWMLQLKTNLLTQLITQLTKVAASDSQLLRIGTLTIAGTDEPIYRLDYGYQHHLVFVNHNNNMLVLSDQGMLASNKGELTPEGNPVLQTEQLTLLAQILTSGIEQQTESLRLDNSPQPPRQTIIIDAHFLSFGYQHFFPGLRAIGFDLTNDGQWRSHVQLDNGLRSDQLDASTLWQQTPAGAALCLALPADWIAGKQLFSEQTNEKKDWERLLDDLTGPLGVCWYPGSRLASPLFMANFKDNAAARQHQAALKSLFSSLIGAGEYIRSERFPVEENTSTSGAYWRRVVSARYGSQLASNEPFRDELSAARYFPVTLAIENERLLFSPDGRLVDQALAVSRHQYPALSEKMQRAANTLAYARPAELSALLEREMYAALPGQIEPLFRESARYYLQPRLKTIAGMPPLSIQTEVGQHFTLTEGSHWYPLRWQDEAQ